MYKLMPCPLILLPLPSVDPRVKNESFTFLKMEVPSVSVASPHAMHDSLFPQLIGLPPIQWRGRILKGHIQFYEQRLDVRLPGYGTKTFSFSKFPTAEATREAAQTYHEQQCLALGLHANEYGYYDDPVSGKPVGVLKLTQHKVMFFSPAHESIVQSRQWYTMRCTKDIFYAATAAIDGPGHFFHNYILPDAKYVDHISHDGLDNRKENLRAVTQSENCKNRRGKLNKLSSAPRGVFHHPAVIKYSWVVRIGKPHVMTRSFSESKYGKAEAHTLAQAFAVQHKPPGMPDVTITIRRQIQRERESWIAAWHDRAKKAKKAQFFVDEHGYDAAHALAVTARSDAEKEHGYM